MIKNLVYVSIALLVCFVVPTQVSAVITDGADAVDLIGQYSDNNFTVSYTKSGINNSPNIFGLSSPKDMEIDYTGHRLFVSDSLNNRVLIYNLNTSNELIDKIPDYVLGQPDFDTSTLGHTQSGMYTPQGLAYDSVHNRLFVSETLGYRVKVFDVSTITNGENAINVLGQTTFTGSIGGNTQSTVNKPQDVIYDPIGNRLFVAEESGNRVKVFDVASITDGENAINVLGQTTFTGTAAGNTQSTLNSPYGLAYDSTNTRLFVSENTSAHRVKVFDVASITDGENAINVLGQTTFTGIAGGNTQSGLNNPYGLAYDNLSQRLFVAEGSGNRVKVFDVASITDGENAINVLGQTTFTGSAGSSTQSGMSSPQGLVYNQENGILYVTEGSSGHRIKLFNTSSITNGQNAVDLVGQYSDNNFIVSYTKSGVNNSPDVLGLNSPRSVAIDTVNHRLFIGENGNFRILIYNLNTSNELIDKIPDYVLGQPDFDTNTTGNSQSKLNSISDIIYDHVHDRLFVSEFSGHRVKVFDVSTITNGENAINVLGQSTFTGSTAGNTQSGLNSPYGLVYDAMNNRLFVAERTGNRVKVFDVASITDGENAINVLGQTTFTGLTAGNTQSGLNGPQGLEYDIARNYLFVSENIGNRVKVFDVASITDGENAINVLGQTTFTGLTAGNTQSGLNGPTGIVFDSIHNRLFVSEFTGNRVKVFDVASITDGENAINVLGQTTFTGLTAGNTQSGLNGPLDIFLNGESGNLFVSESTGNRVKVFSVTPPDIITPTISSVASSTTATTSTITWTTNENATSTLVYGLTTGYGATSTIATATTSHSITLTDLTPETVYHFNITSADPSGNSTSTVDYTFTTDVLPDTTPPSAPTGFTATPSGSTISLSWTNPVSDFASSVIRRDTTTYPASVTDGTLATDTTGTSYDDASLSDGIYYYSIFAKDAVGNTSISATSSATVDTTAPAITSIASSTTTTTATITWTTDENATSTLVYGLTTGYGTASSSLVATTSHVINLSGLTAGTTYHFKINVYDASGNLATSSDRTFTTTSLLVPTLTIQSASSVSTSSAVLNGTLVSVGTASTTSRGFNYGLTSAYGSTTTVGGNIPPTSFYDTVTDLVCNTTYHYQAYSVNSVGTGTSSDATFTTSACSVVEAPDLSPVLTPTVTPGVWVGPSYGGGSSGGGASYIPDVLKTLTATTPTLPNPVPVTPFTRNLSLGMRNTDVLRLQQYLNSRGYLIAPQGVGSLGKETTFFGPATRAALIKFQKAYNINPAIGFFGAVTQAKVNALVK